MLKLTADGVRLSALTNAYFNALREISGNNQGAPPPLKLGAAESVIRWLLVPRFTEVLATASGPVEMENHRTAVVVSHLESGQLDLGIIRADARSDGLELLPFTVLRYVLMVPRSLLPEKSAAGIHAVKVLPIVSISGDGQFVRAVGKVVGANGLPVKILTKVESFSLAVEVAKVLLGSPLRYRRCRYTHSGRGRRPRTTKSQNQAESPAPEVGRRLPHGLTRAQDVAHPIWSHFLHLEIEFLQSGAEFLRAG